MVALVISFALLFLIIDLIRRRRLREEYSVLWFVTGLGIIALVLWYDLLVWVTRFIGAVVPTSTLFFCALIFLFLVCLQFSVRISTLDSQVRQLAQRLALEQIEEPRKAEPPREPR